MADRRWMSHHVHPIYDGVGFHFDEDNVGIIPTHAFRATVIGLHPCSRVSSSQSFEAESIGYNMMSDHHTKTIPETISTYVNDTGGPSSKNFDHTHPPVHTSSSPSISNMVRKQPESPTHPSTDKISSKEHNLHQQNCLTELNLKLGSVTPNDVPSHEREGSTLAQNTGDEKLQQNRIQDPGESQLKVDKALEVLSELAALDSNNYQSNLFEATKSTAMDIVPGNTRFSRLHQSIHRLHSLIRNLTTENDHQTHELLDLHKELEEKNQRIAQLETAVTKLHQRNTKLKKQSKSNQSMARQLFQQVKEYTTNATKRKEKNDFAKLALQIQHHERLLSSNSSNRERTDSNFSELDALDFLQGVDTLSVTTAGSYDTLDNGSNHSSSIYEDGVATLRITRERTTTWPHLTLPTEHGKDRSTYISCTTSPPPEGNKEESLPSPRSRGPTTMNNPFAMFLGPRTVQPYTLSFMAPFELQFVALLLTNNKSIKSEGATPPGADVHQEQSSPPSPVVAFAVCGYHGFDTNTNVKPTVGARLVQINKKDIDSTWAVQDLEEYIRSLGQRTTMTFRNDSWNKPQKEALQMGTGEQERLYPEASTQPTNPFQDVMGGGSSFMRKRSQSGNDGGSCPSTNSHTNLLGFLNFNHHNSAGDDKSKKSVPTKLPAQGGEATTAEELEIVALEVTSSPKGSPQESGKDGTGNSHSPLNSVISSLWNMTGKAIPQKVDGQAKLKDDTVSSESVGDEVWPVPSPDTRSSHSPRDTTDVAMDKDRSHASHAYKEIGKA